MQDVQSERRLATLRTRHAALEDELSRLQAEPLTDHARVQAIKKAKLRIKDEIVGLMRGPEPGAADGVAADVATAPAFNGAGTARRRRPARPRGAGLLHSGVPDQNNSSLGRPRRRGPIRMVRWPCRS